MCDEFIPASKAQRRVMIIVISQQQHRGASDCQGGERRQRGKVNREWTSLERDHSLSFSYHTEHSYSHQGETGAAALE